MAPLVWGDKEQGEQAIKVTGGIKILVLKYSWTQTPKSKSFDQTFVFAGQPDFILVSDCVFYSE